MRENIYYYYFSGEVLKQRVYLSWYFWVWSRLLLELIFDFCSLVLGSLLVIYTQNQAHLPFSLLCSSSLPLFLWIYCSRFQSSLSASFLVTPSLSFLISPVHFMPKYLPFPPNFIIFFRAFFASLIVVTVTCLYMDFFFLHYRTVVYWLIWPKNNARKVLKVYNLIEGYRCFLYGLNIIPPKRYIGV